MSTATSRARLSIAGSILALAAGASMAATPAVIPLAGRARPAVVDKAVRRDPMARRKAKPRVKPRDRMEFDQMRLARAAAKRARKRARHGGWRP